MEKELKIVDTADGSKTIWNPQIGEHYHSRHGALQESRHVFLHSGLKFFQERNHADKINLLEVGFGTGLNFLLSAEYCIQNSIHLNYTGIEAYPLSTALIKQTGYEQFVEKGVWDSFIIAYLDALTNSAAITEYCDLNIQETKLENFESHQYFDIIYFDAFASVHQPEMWTEESLARCCKYLSPGGVFVTYAITGNLKRAMKALGFNIEKAPGAPGKREMLRAILK